MLMYLSIKSFSSLDILIVSFFARMYGIYCFPSYYDNNVTYFSDLIFMSYNVYIYICTSLFGISLFEKFTEKYFLNSKYNLARIISMCKFNCSTQRFTQNEQYKCWNYNSGNSYKRDSCYQVLLSVKVFTRIVYNRCQGYGS